MTRTIGVDWLYGSWGVLRTSRRPGVNRARRPYAPDNPDRGADNVVDAVPALVRLNRGEFRESRQQLQRDLELARQRVIQAGLPGALVCLVSVIS